MSRGKARWEDDSLRQRLPLPGERLSAPRFDGAYIDVDGAAPRLRFGDDGTVIAGDVSGTWVCGGSNLRVSTNEWSAEGAVGPDGVQLLVERFGAPGPRATWELRFAADE